MTDIDSIIETYQLHARARDEANAANKVALFQVLEASAINTLTVTFSGSGDSGQIEDFIAYAGDADVVLPDIRISVQSACWSTGKLDSSEMSLRDAIEELCFACLSHKHGGWEDNDGGEGEFTFFVQDRRIELEFDQFFTDSTCHCHTF